MSSSKARSLRERMSIDPDAPEPVARPRRPRSAPDSSAPPEPSAPPESSAPPEPPRAVPTAAPATEEEPAASRPEPTPDRESPQVDEPEADAPTSSAAPTPVPESPAPVPSRSTPTPGSPATSSPGRPDAPTRSASAARSTGTRSTSARSGRRKTRDDHGWASALDDPSVSAGGNGYRSFYVSDEVFARFRAAVYWTARRPDATDVPDNMSAGIEEYMDQVASDLERRFNGRDVFPPTPDQVKAHRRREGSG